MADMTDRYTIKKGKSYFSFFFMQCIKNCMKWDNKSNILNRVRDMS